MPAVLETGKCTLGIRRNCNPSHGASDTETFLDMMQNVGVAAAHNMAENNFHVVYCVAANHFVVTPGL